MTVRLAGQADADALRVEAEVILAGLPVEEPGVVAVRRLVLAHDGATVAVMAAELLAVLPRDPEAGEHRRVLAEAVGGGSDRVDFRSCQD